MSTRTLPPRAGKVIVRGFRPRAEPVKNQTPVPQVYRHVIPVVETKNLVHTVYPHFQILFRLPEIIIRYLRFRLFRQEILTGTEEQRHHE